MSPRIFTFILYTFIHLKSLKPFFRHNVKVMQSPQIADFTPPLWATARSVADSSSECFDPSVHCGNMEMGPPGSCEASVGLRVSSPSRSDSTRQKPLKIHLHRSDMAWLLVSIQTGPKEQKI